MNLNKNVDVTSKIIFLIEQTVGQAVPYHDIPIVKLAYKNCLISNYLSQIWNHQKQKISSN